MEDYGLEHFYIGELGRPKGLKGEISLSLANPFEDYEAYFKGRPTLFTEGESMSKGFLGRLETFRRNEKNPKLSTVKISTLRDRKSAEEASGKKVFISKNKVSRALKEKSNLPHPGDLLGFLLKLEGSEVSSKVISFYETPAHPVLVTSDFEAPYVEALISGIQVDEKSISYRGAILPIERNE